MTGGESSRPADAEPGPEPRNVLEWEEHYRHRAFGAMNAAMNAVGRNIRTVDQTEAVAIAQIEAAGRIAAALILAEPENKP